MNKTELIEHIAKHADISKAAATRALESTIGAVKTTLKKGGTVSLVGFGTFAVGKRAARTGRNPRTGEAIKIKAAKVPKFRPGKGIANPIGQIWCGAMMLEFLGHKDAHDAVMVAIEKVLDPKSGAPKTPDIGGNASTSDLGRAIAEAL